MKKNKNTKDRLLLWGILALGTILRFFMIWKRPFDGDEGIVLKVANFSHFKDIFQGAATDVHPPLLHYLIHISIKIFGFSTFSARLPSALAGIGAIYFSFLIFKKLFNEKTGLISALLVSLSALLIYSSQEARFYSLLVFLFLGAFYFTLKIREQSKLSSWLWFGLFSIAMVYCQYLGWFLLGFLSVILIWQKKDLLKNIISIIAVWAIALLAYIPQIPIMLNQIHGRLSEQPATLAIKANLVGIFNAFYRFSAGRIFLDLNPSFHDNIAWLKSQPLIFVLFLITLILPAVFFVAGIIYSIQKKLKGRVLVLSIFILGILLSLAISEIGSRSVRYLLFVSPFYYCLLAIGIIYFWKRQWGKILSVGLILIFGWALVNYYHFTVRAAGENTVSQFVAENIKENEAVLVKGSYGGGDSFIFSYYWPKNKPEPAIYDFYGDYKVGNLSELKNVPLEDKINEALKDHPAVWVYDFTYSQEAKDLAEKNNAPDYLIGFDKEGKPIILWYLSR